MVGLSVRATVLLVVCMCLMTPHGKEAQCTSGQTTVVQGTVFLETPDDPASAPGAKVIVQGDFLIVSTITDREGKFRFSDLEPGSYTVKATYFGLYAEQKITVEPGAVVQVALQLKLPDLKAPPKS